MRLRPSIPVGAIAALGVAFAMLATLVYFVYTDLTPLYVPPFNPNPDQLSATVIAIGALLCGLAAGWAMYRRRERVPALLAWSVTLSAASLFAYLAGQIRSYNGFEMEDYASTATTMVPDTRVAALGLALLVLALPVLALLLGEGRTRTWFLRGASSDTRLIAAATFAYRRPLSWLRVLVAPVVVWLAIPLLADGVNLLSDVVRLVPVAGAMVADALDVAFNGNADVRAMLAAVLCLAATFAVRYRVSTNGVSLLLGTMPLLHASWHRVRWVDRVESGGLCVHYTSRFGWPCSLTLRPGALEEGNRIAAFAHQIVHDRNVRHRTWSGVRGATAWGWTAIGASVALMVAQSLWSSALMAEVDGVSAERFASLAAPVQGVAWYDLTLLLFGLGIGILGARTSGSGSLTLVVGLMMGATVLPSPLLHWLVWIACYAVLAAIQTPVDHSTIAYTLPSALQWDVAFTMAALGPAFAALGYLAGTMAGRKPHKLLRSPAGGPEPTKPMETGDAVGQGALYLPGMPRANPSPR